MEDSKIKRYLFIFAVYIVSASFLYFFCVTFCQISESGKHFADIILGVLIGTGVNGTIGYYFGSSKGSSDKNESIQKMIK